MDLSDSPSRLRLSIMSVTKYKLVLSGTDECQGRAGDGAKACSRMMVTAGKERKVRVV